MAPKPITFQVHARMPTGGMSTILVIVLTHAIVHYGAAAISFHLRKFKLHYTETPKDLTFAHECTGYLLLCICVWHAGLQF